MNIEKRALERKVKSSDDKRKKRRRVAKLLFINQLFTVRTCIVIEETITMKVRWKQTISQSSFG